MNASARRIAVVASLALASFGCCALVAARIPLSGASDHGVSVALYLHDPDGNGVELYYDRPKEEWPRSPDGGGIAMYTHPVDLEALLADAPI